MNKRFRTIKHDYRRRNFSNPFFAKKKTAPKRLNSRWVILAAIFGLAFIIWLVLAAPFWNIKHVKVNGLTRLPAAELEGHIYEQAGKRRLLFFSQKNIWLFDREEVEIKVIDIYNFSNFRIKKGIPNRLILEVKERPYAFLYQEGSAIYYASADGFAIKDIAVGEEDKKKYFILENQGASLIGDKDKINIKPEYLNFIFELYAALSDYQDLPLERFVIDSEMNTVKAKFIQGPLVLFNTKSATRDQLERLAIAKREKIKDNFSSIDYIDIRYGDRLFISPALK